MPVSYPTKPVGPAPRPKPAQRTPHPLPHLAFANLATTTRLRPADLALVALYLLGITLFGLHFRAKKSDPNTRSLQSYFLANNEIPWWAIGLSIVSAETSTLTIISIPGLSFAGNMGFLQIVFGYMLGRILVALLFLPRYFGGNLLTAYQLINQRFGPTLHKTTAGLFLLTRAAAEGVRVFAISIVVGIAIGTGDILSIAIISALTLLYTFEGGMAAVVWTDVVQMLIYLVGTAVALFTLGAHIPGGWHTIHTIGAAQGKFHVLHFALNLTQNYTFWAGVLGGTALTMASHGTDQLMVQRLLAARSLNQSRAALLGSGLVVLLQFTLFLLIGVGLFVFYAQHPQAFTSTDRIFPTFIVREMPSPIAGLLVAAILAAAMSNLSAALNSLSSTTVVDFYLHWRPLARLASPTADRERALVSRLSTVLWAVLLFLIAVYAVHAGGKGHVVETGLSIASVAYGSLLGVFLLGTLTRFATERGTILGMITGFSVNLLLWLHPSPLQLGPIHLPHIAFTWYVLIGALVTFAVGALSSLLFRKQSRPETVATATVLAFAFLVVIPGGNLHLHAQASLKVTPLAVPHAAAHEDPALAAEVPRVPHPLRSLIAQRVGSATEAPGHPPSSNQPDAPPLPQPRRAMSQPTPDPPTPDFTPTDHLITTAIAAHKLPGAVLLVGHSGHIVYQHAFGSRKLPGEPGLNGTPSPAEPMTVDTIFDIASLTKVIVTTTAIMQLHETGKIQSFDDPVAKYLPAFATANQSQITLRNLLTHTSGLPPDIDLKDPWGLAAPDRAEGLRRALNATPTTPPGTHFEYSDINFILLGHIVETLSGESLNTYAALHIFLPLGMYHGTTNFHPYDRACGPKLLVGSAVTFSKKMPKAYECVGLEWWDATYSLPNTAPTAHDNEGTPATNPNFDRLLRGTVHDPTTRRMGGVAGHAGVFSTAHDLSLFAQALLDRIAGRPSSFPLTQASALLMTTPEQPGHTPADLAQPTPKPSTPTYPSRPAHQVRGFGWDIDSAFSRPRGEVFPIGSFGHTGFTGTSLWLDPGSDTYVILLANSIHPHATTPISGLRGEVSTAVARTLHLYGN